MSRETLSFQAEVQQLLNLMIHSLYSNKEIFVRELVSNASDALDRQRFEEVTNRSLLSSSRESAVRVSVLPESRQLIIEDNGIGMNRDELINNLGTIASSGTKKFLESIKDGDKKDLNMIGQFGVGFYSAFMVAEKVVVETLSARGGEAFAWESTGDGKYELGSSTRTERGTRIEITLKEEDKEFCEEWRLRGIVQKYSDYVTYPIYFIDKENRETRWNKTTPVWVRPKKENKAEDYNELYKQISRDYADPLLYEHITVEGLTSFTSVVFVPSQAPFDLYTRDSHGLHLYVKRVSIMESCKELIPEYLRFVAGVVETDELPLNVSREILQQNNKLTVMKKQITKKTLSALLSFSKEKPEEYKKFWETFGAVLKEGFHFDHENHETLSELVLFRTSKTGADQYISFKEYIERKAKDQRDIYYLTGPSWEVCMRTPHLEAVQSRDIEVIFLTDPIDEWFVMDYSKHGEYALKSIMKGDLDLNGVGKEPEEEVKKDDVPAPSLAGLLDAIRGRLTKEIKDVKVSSRLKESPCCLIAEDSGMSSQMERIMKMTNKEFTGSRKILEVNPSHPIIKNLAHLKELGQEEKLGEWVEVLFDTALLSEGASVRNPSEFARKLNRMMEEASKV